MNDTNNWVQYVRTTELATAKPFLIGGKYHNLLDLGGGDGYVAKLLTEQGFNVISIDVKPLSAHYAVQKASADALPFPDKSFDIVFSSHVIAHLKNKKGSFEEMRRVLKPGGIAVHIVPSPWWSLLTNTIHMLKVPRMVAGSLFRRLQGRAHDSIRSIVLHPLGTSPSFVHEVFLFSPTGWELLFKRNGFRVERIERGPLVQSGYRVFPFRLLGLRKFMSGFFPSSYCFVVCPSK